MPECCVRCADEGRTTPVEPGTWYVVPLCHDCQDTLAEMQQSRRDGEPEDYEQTQEDARALK